MRGQARYSGQLVVNRNLIVPLFLLCLLVAVPANTFGLTINVVDPAGTPVTQFRWLMEKDNTHPVKPGVSDPTSLTFGIHLSCATVIAADQVMMDAFGNTADIPSGSDDGGLDEFFEFIPKSRSSSSIRFFNWIISFSNCFIYASLSIK